MKNKHQLIKRIPQIQVSFDPNRSLSGRIYIRSSEEVFKVMQKLWDKKTINLYEEFKVLYLDRRNGIIGYRTISKGGVAGTVVDIKHVFAIALKSNSSGLVLCHNHPSGGVQPSRQDLELTSKIYDASMFFNLKLIDHLIITPYKYYSFMDEGQIS